MTYHYWCAAWLLLLGKRAAAESSCGVYFAESTIPGAGYGMFAGRDFREGEQVTDGDVVVPIIELSWHTGHEDWNFLWEEYTWTSSTFLAMDEETDNEPVSGASPGIGAALNCMDALVNVDASYTEIDNAGLHRSRDPGVGAYTPYHDRRSFAIQDIPAGQELYISYGDNYFQTRTDSYGLIPLWRNFELADDLIHKYQRILPGHASVELSYDLWDMVANMPGFQSRTLNALPKNATDVPVLAEVGTAMQYYNKSIRDLDWLEEHGKCMDNIRPGLSTIPQAGRGAFATRFLPKGSLVAPAPLIHIPDKSRMIMYEALPMDEHQYILRNTSAPVHRQMIVNYCFGHANSTLLLSPYGSITSLINHSSKSPNTRIEWAKDMRHPEWLNRSLSSIDNEWHSGLAFDYVALRDIEPGEEILIDYGQEWQDAWDKHVRNWVPPKGAESYEAAYELNNNVDLVVRTIHERPYSDNLVLYVWGLYRTMSGLPQEDFDWYRGRVLDRYEVKGETMYMMELYIVRHYERDKTNVEYVNEILFGVPRDAIVFRDLPYTRDHRLTNSFRHEMMIPDEMFPEAWKNL